MMRSMSVLAQILDHLRLGADIPAELLEDLSSEDRLALKNFELEYREQVRLQASSLLLLHTASELTGGRDRQKMLRDIVHSARSVIGSDIGYISINDEQSQKTRILMTSGVLTDGFKNISMPLGTGILGLVASRDGAAWTHDHASDPVVTHIPEVDVAVQGEGIHGILGAPMQVKGQLIGALLVGDRTPRNYTRSEVMILTALASLAAVALETIQLIDDLHRSVRQLEESERAQEQHIRDMEALAKADERLLEALMDGARLRSVHRILKEILDAPVAIWRGNELLESVHPMDDAPPDEPTCARYVELLKESTAQGSVQVDKEAGLTALSIDVDHRHLGGIGIGRALTDAECRILHRAAASLAILLLFREALATAETRQVDDLMRKLMEGRGSKEDIARLKRIMHMPAEHTQVQVGILLWEERNTGGRLSRSMIREELPPHSLVLLHEDHMCLLIANPDDQDNADPEVLEALLSRYGKEYGLYCGLSATHFSSGPFALAHRDAHLFANAARSLKLPTRIATATTTGSIGLLIGAQGSLITNIIDTCLGPLLGYDQRTGSELVETASAYLDQDRSVRMTARALFVHENTIRQRLNRIAELLGEDWCHGHRSLDMHVALRAHLLSQNAAKD